MFKESGKRTYVLLFLLILIGLILRLYNLGKESLWIDEIEGSILTAKQSITYILNPNIDMPINAYHIILHYWMQIFGQSAFSVRFPALIFGMLSIFAIYKLGRVLFNQEIGLLSALILAISPFQIHYSQEAKPYSLLMLLSLISTYYFVKFIKSDDKKNFHRKFDSLIHKILNFIKNKKNIGIYIVSTLIGIYTHYFIFFLLIFQNVYFFMYNIKNKNLVKSWLILQGIIVLIFSLYSPFFLKQIIWGLNGGFIYLNQYFSLFSIIKTFYVITLDYAFINSNYCIPCFHVNPFIIFLVGIVFLLLISLGIKGLFVYKKNFKEWIYKNEKLIFLILYLFIPIVILYTISFIAPLFQTRYVIYSSAPLYILISKGISGFKKRTKLSFIFLLLFLFSFVLFSYYNDVTKEQWREASNFIDKSSKESAVIIYPYSTFIFEYYDVKIDKKRLIPNDYPYPKDSYEVYGKPLKPKDINQITSNYNRVWLVLPPAWELKDYEEITKEFKTLILEKEFKGVKIYLFEI
jgi:uncharacterized membrane protein